MTRKINSSPRLHWLETKDVTNVKTVNGIIHWSYRTKNGDGTIVWVGEDTDDWWFRSFMKPDFAMKTGPKTGTVYILDASRDQVKILRVEQ